MTETEEVEAARGEYGDPHSLASLRIRWVPSKIPAEELDPTHPLWDAALLVINELAPVTRRDDWWGTAGPKTIIFRALIAAQRDMREPMREPKRGLLPADYVPRKSSA